MGLYVGTAGTAMWMSGDSGENWIRPYTDRGLYMESRIWSLTSQPAGGPGVVAGTDRGVYRWHWSDMRWEHLASQLDSTSVYTIAQSPHDDKVLIAGTQPPSVYRSADGGATWKRADLELPQTCELVGIPRITQVLFDAVDPKLVWVCVEIGGVFRSRDGGQTWHKTSTGLVSEDMHGLAVVRENGARKLFATTNKGLHVSTDDGDTWTHRPLDTPWVYLRAIVPKADDDRIIFTTTGNGPPGSDGRVYRSDDFGETWRDAGLPEGVNSTAWCVAVHPQEPSQVFVSTCLGQVYRSMDGGHRWEKLRREFGEIRSLMLRPMDGEWPPAS
jgi:photosystem II stability/assembly factor-like uncharacterized protein